MGEWAKKIGEHGEGVVAELLEMIGWADAQTNLELPCVQGHKHGSTDRERRTHGIDKFFSYQSRLVDRTLDHLVISVKYSAAPYPSSPNSKFKEHFIDLAMTLECFRRSSLRNAAGKSFSGVENARNIGVLFWLTNDRSNLDVLPKVATARKLDDYAYETIFVVDDFRAAFLFDSIQYVRTKHAADRVEFLYQSTGRNINPATRENAGVVLPAEFVNSPILPIRVIKADGGKILVLCCIEEFHPDRLRRLIGLAQNLTQDFAKEAVILFPHYDQLLHDNQVKEAKAGFDDKGFTESVRVGAFRSDFRDIQE